jgi:hypothetical protein
MTCDLSSVIYSVIYSVVYVIHVETFTLVAATLPKGTERLYYDLRLSASNMRALLAAFRGHGKRAIAQVKE